jgi:hypothetical protein
MKQPKRRRRKDGKRQIGFRATPEEIARLDRIAKEYTGKLPAGGGGRVKRSEATRYAVKVGLDAIELELGLPLAYLEMPASRLEFVLHEIDKLRLSLGPDEQA